MNAIARRALYCAAMTVLLGSAANPASAQVPGAATGSANPGRAQEQFTPRDLAPRHIPQIEVREMKLREAPPGSENISFTLTGLALDGVTAYSPAELDALYADKIGSTITLADLYGIAAELTRKYRNDGYILTQIVVPPQTIDGGMPRLQVVEGYVGDMIVQSTEKDSATKLVRDYMNTNINTSGTRPLNVKELERALLLINDLPGMNARSILSPSPSKPGAAELLVIVDRKPFDAVIGIDNFGTRFLGPIQLSGAASLNSMLNANERFTFQTVVAPEDKELQYFMAGFAMPVWKYGTSFNANASRTLTEPGYRLTEFDINGESSSINFGFTHPFIRSRTANITGRILFDFRNVETSSNIEDTRRDKLRNLRIGGKFEKLENSLGLAYNVLDLEVSKGIDILHASQEDQLNMTRPFADPEATKLAFEFQRLQRIAPDFNVLIAMQGQISTNPLLSSEEFGVGGQNYGRGYDSSEILGEEGIAGKFEIQWNKPLNLDPMPVMDHQLYAFYDIGKVWNDDATAASQEEISLASAGLGIRADLNQVTAAGLMVAFPLNRTPQTEDHKSPRLYVNLNRKF